MFFKKYHIQALSCLTLFLNFLLIGGPTSQLLETALPLMLKGVTLDEATKNSLKTFNNNVHAFVKRKKEIKEQERVEDEKKAKKLIKELSHELKGLIVRFVPFGKDDETTVGEALRLLAVTQPIEMFKQFAEPYIKLLVNKGKPNVAEWYGKAKKSGLLLHRPKFLIIGDIGDKVSLEFLKIDALSKKSANINYLQRSMLQHLKVNCDKISKSAKKRLFLTLDNIVTFVKNQHELTGRNFNLYQQKANLEEKLGDIEKEQEEMERVIHVETKYSYTQEFYGYYNGFSYTPMYNSVRKTTYIYHLGSPYGEVESKEWISPYSLKGLTLNEKYRRITNPSSYIFCHLGYGHCPYNKKEINRIKSLSDQKEIIKKKLEQVNMLQNKVKSLLEN